VLFCPGGQAEMVHAWKAFLSGDKRELVLHTRHRGFCRCAWDLLVCIVIILHRARLNTHLRCVCDLRHHDGHTHNVGGY
jgi:hypothetical protein